MKDLSAELKAIQLGICRGIRTPLSERIERYVNDGMWDAIARCKVDPKDYNGSQSYFLDATVASVLRKCRDLPTNFDRDASALESWKGGEVDCYKTNERLSPYIEGFTHPDVNTDVLAHIEAIRKKISDVLGRAPAMGHLMPRHGPGATFTDVAERSTIADKMQYEPSMTHSALWFLPDFWGTAWGREASDRGVYPCFVRGNRFTTAPKDAMKNRPIAAEPSINIFYQLGLAQEVRSALKRVGIDLANGQDLHRRIACEASITGDQATLDLKNASDTVAYNLVKLLLPPDWFSLFDELRSPFTRMGDRYSKLLKRQCKKGEHWVKLEKFSSMGNGYTFELETLLFWAISDYACSQAISDDPPMKQTLVYGDDIIVDTRGVEAVISCLRFFGMTINEEKSFWTGPFRESCGGDFWKGRNVRPYFQKESPDEPHQLIAAVNQIRRVATDLFGGTSRLTGLWLTLQLQLPVQVRRCRGPQRLGDNVIHDLECNWSWTSVTRRSLFAYQPVSHREVKLANYEDGVIHACGLYGLEVSSGVVLPRDSVTGYAVRRVPAYGIHWLPANGRSKRWDLPTLPTPREPTGPRYSISGVVKKSSVRQVWVKFPDQGYMRLVARSGA